MLAALRWGCAMVVLRLGQINAPTVPAAAPRLLGFTEDPEVAGLCDRGHELTPFRRPRLPLVLAYCEAPKVPLSKASTIAGGKARDTAHVAGELSHGNKHLASKLACQRCRQTSETG